MSTLQKTRFARWSGEVKKGADWLRLMLSPQPYHEVLVLVGCLATSGALFSLSFTRSMKRDYPPGRPWSIQLCLNDHWSKSFLHEYKSFHSHFRALSSFEFFRELWYKCVNIMIQVLRDNIGSAIRPKNSRPVVPHGFMLRAAADFSGLDVQIFYNLGSYDSPESPL